jgi:signal transduction histidine kinase
MRCQPYGHGLAIAEQRGNSPDAPLGTIIVRSAQCGEHVTITVADDGPGMVETVRRRIFDPFFTTKDVGKGTGQGLTQVHATIVKKHGGTIRVESSPGDGTTFTITLPRCNVR